MYAFMKEKDVLLNELCTDSEKGLCTPQAAANAEQYGKNVLQRAKPMSLSKRIAKAASEPMIIMLIAAGLITLSVNIILAATGGDYDFLECAGVFAAISLSVAITVVMEGKSAKAFEALSRVNENLQVKVIRDGHAVTLNQQDLVAGDIVLLAAGDKIPADGRLLAGSELCADESALTGESVPVTKDADMILTDDKTPVAERRNMVYCGSYITGGFGKMLVTAVGERTEFGKIAQELGKTEEASTPLQERLFRLGKMITVFGVIAASVVFISQLISFAASDGLHFAEVMEAFVTSIVLIVAAVPEGLPTIVAVSLSINIIKLSKQNALVKKMIASETVGCINVICSDKTGTLTENKMTVTAIWDKQIIPPAALTSGLLTENFCLNSTADIADDARFIGNPTECALLSAARANQVDYQAVRSSAEILHVFPFTSDDKHMTTIIRREDGIRAYVKGSPERILSMCAVSAEQRVEIEQAMADYQRRACRILAFSHKDAQMELSAAFDQMHAFLETDMCFDGFAAIADPLRAEVYEAVAQCKTAGIELKMLTGDNLLTATAIANELGLLSGNGIAVEARTIDDLSDAALAEQLPCIAVIARSTPAIKMRVVNLLKAEGNVVAVTGDGINDAPALKNADVGIAMGVSGTEVSKEASDIVLLDDSFATIVHAVRWGRGIYENFKRFISFQLTVNVSSVIVVLTSILLGLKAPFTALQLLWINIIMDGPPALTLGLEPIHGDLMNRQPIGRSENILSKPLLLKIGLTGLYMSVIFLLQYSCNFLGASAEQMPTVLFALFALFQLFNAFNCRELHAQSIFRHLLKNKLMLLVIAVTFVLQILLIQFAGAFFGTVALPLSLWGKIIALAASVIVLSEAAKGLYRLFHQNAKNKK